MKPIQAQIDAIKLAQLGSDAEYREALHDAEKTLHALKNLSEIVSVMEDMKEALEHSSNQMNRARNILQENTGGNWGILDSSTQEQALEKYNTLFKKP